MASFFSWWYGLGWKEVVASLRPRLRTVSEAFSVKQLLRTMFEPWRRITSNPGRSLGDRFQAWADNMFSRAIGFVVRSFVLLGAGVTLILIAILTIIEIVLWPILPVAIPVLLVLGVIS